MAAAIMTGMVGQLLRVKPKLTLQEIKDVIVDDDYSFPIVDCKSTHCSAFSIACDRFAVIASGTEYPTSFPTPPTSAPTEPTHIECGQTLTGSLGGMWWDPEVVLLDFENRRVRDVTFTDCDSSFDTMLFLADSNGVDIQRQSTNHCGGDDCYDPELCSTSGRETFTMSDLEIGSYTLRLTSHGSGGGGDWSLTVQCQAASPTENPPPTSAPTAPIECGQTLTGSVGNRPDSLSVAFENDQIQSVTFSNCDSTFDTTMFLADSNGADIQQQSTNHCDGDDCHDPEFCRTSYRETFTMSHLQVGSYTMRLIPYSEGGDWSLTVLCEVDGRGQIAAAFDEVDTDEWRLTMAGKDMAILVLMAINAVSIVVLCCLCTRSKGYGEAKYKVVAVAAESEFDLEDAPLRR